MVIYFNYNELFNVFQTFQPYVCILSGCLVINYFYQTIL